MSRVLKDLIRGIHRVKLETADEMPAKLIIDDKDCFYVERKTEKPSNG